MAKKSDCKRYPCTYDGCKATFPRPSKLALHMQIHEGKNPFPCDIDGCDKSYTTKAHLRRHKDNQHTETNLQKAKPKCTVEGCIQEFASITNMNRHIKRIHDRLYEYKCPVCNQGFTKKKQLHQHSYLHTGDHYYKCEICDLGFNTLSDCNKHKNTHTWYQCDHCSEEFERWSDLRKHKVVHKPILRCTECHYKTKSKLLLDAHLKVHFAPGSRRRFRCSYKDCKRHYLYEKNLQFHVKTFHEGFKRKRLPCTSKGCKATLAHVAALKKHLVVKHSTLATFQFTKPRRLRRDCGVPRKNIIDAIVGFHTKESTKAISSEEDGAHRAIRAMSEESNKCQEVFYTDENERNQMNTSLDIEKCL